METRTCSALFILEEPDLTIAHDPGPVEGNRIWGSCVKQLPAELVLVHSTRFDGSEL